MPQRHEVLAISELGPEDRVDADQDDPRGGDRSKSIDAGQPLHHLMCAAEGGSILLPGGAAGPVDVEQGQDIRLQERK